MPRTRNAEGAAPDSVPRPIRASKERAHLGGLMTGIKQVGVSALLGVATKECPASAPAAAADDFTRRLDDKVGSVLDQLGIQSPRCPDCCLNLLGGVVVCAEAAS